MIFPQAVYQDLSIGRLHLLLKKREISVCELVESIYDRIENVESKIHAFITLIPKSMLRSSAKMIDKMFKQGIVTSPLQGIPVAVKDSFLTEGVRTTAGSKILRNYIGQYDATLVRKLKQSGAIIVGKTNLDEFSLGFTTETSAFGVTSNPWDTKRLPGGSSGGSAAAVAAGEAIFALGSEHYDSIRQPAAWCGVVGLKPTYGLVSRFGIIAMASSLECPGPITKTVEDAAIVMKEISGFDENDANSSKADVPDYTAHLNDSVKNMKIGLAEEYLSEEFLDSEIIAVIEAAMSVLTSLGAEVVKIKLPPLKHTSPIFEVLYRSEVASNLARYDGIRYGRNAESDYLEKLYFRAREGFGPLLKFLMVSDLRSISGGKFYSIYRDALKFRTLVNQSFEKIFKKVDLVIGPTSPSIAFKKGFYKDGSYRATRQTDKYRPFVDIIAQLPALCGLPGISVPCGFSENLPVGLNIYGPKFSESKILNLAHLYEQETAWRERRPGI